MKQTIFALFIGASALLLLGCPGVTIDPPDLEPSTIVFADGNTIVRTLGTGSFINSASGDGTGDVTWSSDTPGTASVDSVSGTVTLVAAGTAQITASKAATATHSAVTASFTLTVKPILSVGDLYEGGAVAYILAPGDDGYDPVLQHGLIGALENVGAPMPWIPSAHQSTALSSAGGTAIGTGSANTAAIVALAGAGTTYAAGACDAWTNLDTGTGVYSDWYLPSRDELERLLYIESEINFPAYYFTNPDGPPDYSYTYWSSSESSSTETLALPRADDYINPYVKSATFYVRAVRSF